MTAIRIIDSHLELADIGANDHHNELHSIASHNDTSATGAQLDTLTDNSIADTLHRHSELVASDGTPDPALSVDAAGKVGVSTLSPEEKLHVGGGAVLLDNGHWYKTKLSGGAKVRNFGTGGDDIAYFGGIDAAQTELRFRTAGTNKLTIVSNGRVGIGTITPATSAILDLTSITGALLFTRMTTAQKNALTAVNGMVLYDSTLNKFQGYENGVWTNLI